MERSHRRILGLLLVLALGVRLGWVLSRPTDLAALEQLPDQREYLESGRNLLHAEGLFFTDPRFVQRVYAHRTPGYPLLIAASGANVVAVRIVQALIDTSTVLAAFLLARRWLPPYACLFAALLIAFNPFLVYFCGLLLTETLFTAMLAWGMLLLTSARTIPWLAGGIVLALSVLVRPGAIGLPVILGVMAAMTNRRSHGAYQRRWPLPVGTTMLLLTVLALLPWASRNRQVLGRWIWTSTNEGITRYDGFNPDATGASDQRFVQAMPQLIRMGETERNDYLAEQANQFIRQRPLDALQLAGAKILRTWSPRPLSGEFSRPLYVAVALGYAIPLAGLFVAGLALAPLDRWVKLFLTAPAIYLTLTVALSVGSLRYRLPAEVPMAVVAAGALARAPAHNLRHRTKDERVVDEVVL